ncbi:MAG: inosine/xanthosine triphosphatase [Candidatus Diapherotrites archaeon]|nr:inosine/xanthosine triphosphatase [Candidatus Diapherotrites archaeon]
MIVTVGSKNPVKVRAVEKGFAKYFKGCRVDGIEVETGVKEQPTDFGEIVQGAKNRAKKAFEAKKCDYSVGIESGVFPEKEANSKWLDATCIAIFDGKKFHLGFSPMFEYPKNIVEKALKERISVGEALEKLYGIKNPRYEEGIIGWLTKGKMPRDKLHEQGVIVALASIVSREKFE